MMHAHADEVFRARRDIAIHQSVRIKLLRRPQWNDVLVAELGRMSIMLEMMGVKRVTGDVHPTGIPIASARDRLRSPMRPDAKLGISKPRRRLVGFQRFHGRLEWTAGDRK